MKPDLVSSDDLRRALVHHHYAGLPLANASVAELYATVASTPTPASHAHASHHSSQPDWAFISYVSTESALGSGGMPDWVAADAELVLEDLYRHRFISKRAVVFDRILARQMPMRWPALATLHALAVPVICVPPSRTLDYARYQIPPQWTPATADYFTGLELVLRQCQHCVHRCPLEHDPRLLNLAATLRSWPVIEALIASNARGAFISFATLDRIRYTLAWYQVLLQLCMRLFTQRQDPDDDGDELFGPALFEPCQRCVVFSARVSRDEPLTQHIDALEESLASLVAQAHRFCLPSARPGEGHDIWSLQGAFRASGERANIAISSSALSIVSTASHPAVTLSAGSNGSSGGGGDQTVGGVATVADDSISAQVISQPQFEHIAASVVSGRISLGPCFNPADKWLCAFILANVSLFLRAFDQPVGTFPATCRSTLLSVVRSDNPLGAEFRPRENVFNQDSDDVCVSRCIRCAPCGGTADCVCFFNELSGIMPPSSVGSLFHTWGLRMPRLRRFLSACEIALKKRMVQWGHALESFEFELGDLTPYNKNHCFHCRKAYARTDQYFVPLILLAWETRPFVPSDVDQQLHQPQLQEQQREEHNQHQHQHQHQHQRQKQQKRQDQNHQQEQQHQSSSPSPPSPRQRQQQQHQQVSPCFTFVTFNLRETKHLWSRGMFNLDDVIQCKLCRIPFTRAKVSDTEDSLEIHTGKPISITSALNNVFDGIRASHGLASAT